MRQSQTVTLPGINIQAPWAEAIVSGRKVIETRFYPMPRKWVGQPLAIIETPGKARHFQAADCRAGDLRAELVLRR